MTGDESSTEVVVCYYTSSDGSGNPVASLSAATATASAATVTKAILPLPATRALSFRPAQPKTAWGYSSSSFGRLVRGWEFYMMASGPHPAHTRGLVNCLLSILIKDSLPLIALLIEGDSDKGTSLVKESDGKPRRVHYFVYRVARGILYATSNQEPSLCKRPRSGPLTKINTPQRRAGDLDRPFD